MESPTLQPLEEQIQSLSTSPGVYLMKDREGTVLYVGKAKNLRNRVKTYFSKSGDSRHFLRLLIPKIQQIDTLLTDTEKEALILENTLIKKYKPRHNIKFIDDKTYYSLKINPHDPFPKLILVRKIKKDEGCYFGPFASSTAVKETLKLLGKIFPLRTCSEANFKNRSRPCLNFQIKRCLAPCSQLISREKYAEMVQEVLLFLAGKNRQLHAILRGRMKSASDDLNFEEAARIRDQIQGIEQTLERQKAVCRTRVDRDVFAFYRRGNSWEFQILFLRRGILVGNKSLHVSRLNLPEEEALSAFVRRYYGEDPFIPSEILLPMSIEDEAVIREWLSEKKGGRAEVLAPHKGEKKHLVEMARKNAESNFQKKVSEKEITALMLKEVQEKLRLKNLPHRMECFDVSNLFGTFAVGSLVSFLDGTPDRSHYRRYKVRAPSFPDDYAMMYEILNRRYSQLRSAKDAPDLLMVDGGKGQLNIALAVLSELGLQNIPAIGLAKDKEIGPGRSAGKTSDKIFLPKMKDPVILPANSATLRYLQRIRDEAHRFAVTYHKKLRGKEGLRTILNEITGIGIIKRNALLREFGSLQKIEGASLERLTRVEPLTARDAQSLFQFFHPKISSEPIDTIQD